MDNTAPVLITPECHTPGCHNDGDQFTMIKCRLCGHWFCGSHLDPAQTLQLSPQRRLSCPYIRVYVSTAVPGNDNAIPQTTLAGSTRSGVISYRAASCC